MRLRNKIKQNLLKFIDWLNDDISGHTHPQIDFIPPIIFKLLLLMVLLIILIGLSKKLFEHLAGLI